MYDCQSLTWTDCEQSLEAAAVSSLRLGVAPSSADALNACLLAASSTSAAAAPTPDTSHDGTTYLHGASFTCGLLVGGSSCQIYEHADKGVGGMHHQHQWLSDAILLY